MTSDEAWTRVRAAWPDAGVSREAFDSAAAQRAGADEVQLYLLLALEAQLPWAMTHLEQAVRAQRQALRRLGLDDDASSEVLQALRAWLLVPVNGRRRVSSWAARGPLEAWLRTIVVRQGLRVRRAQVEFSSRLEAAVQTSPELLVMKAQLRELFAAALREAMASLEGPQRALLHRYYVDRLTIDELAEEHRVHRATAARWVAAAQRTLLSDVRRLLLARHQLGRSALNSAIRLVRSELGVSWSRLEPG